MSWDALRTGSREPAARLASTVLSQQAIRLQQLAEQQSVHEIAAALAELESTAARIMVEPAKVDEI